MTLTRIALPICFGLIVAACGGGGAGPTFDDLIAEANALSDFTDPLDLSPSIPAAGTASYAGILAFGEEFAASGEALIADAHMDVNFGDGTLDGDVTSFFTAEYDSEGEPITDGTSVSGALTLMSESVAAGFFNIDVDGTLDYEGQSRDVSGSLTSAFGGASAQAIVGLGEISLSGTTTKLLGALLAREE